MENEEKTKRKKGEDKASGLIKRKWTYSFLVDRLDNLYGNMKNNFAQYYIFAINGIYNTAQDEREIVCL